MKPNQSPLRERASCGSCEFGEMHEDNDNLFYCRRRAPTLAISNMHAIFPIVHDDDWCGDFREEVNA